MKNLILLLMFSSSAFAGSGDRLKIEHDRSHDFSCSAEMRDGIVRFIFYGIASDFKEKKIDLEGGYAPWMLVFLDNVSFSYNDIDFDQIDIGARYYSKYDKLSESRTHTKTSLNEILGGDSEINFYGEKFNLSEKVSDQTLFKYIHGNDVVFDLKKDSFTKSLFKEKDKPKDAYFWVSLSSGLPMKCHSKVTIN